MPTIAGYITRKTLSESSATILFHAHHPITEQTVVLKLLKGDHPQNAQLNRFKREYTLTSSFDSNYIIKTYGLEKHHNSLVMVLEDCCSSFDSLDQVIHEQQFNLEKFLRISIEIAKGLETLHSNHVIHRDLNPTNILISKNSKQIKLIDFSISTGEVEQGIRYHSAQLPEGTLPYISPEQTGRLEQSIDYRTDFYSLGVTLFHFATGSMPFTGDNPSEIIHAHLAKSPLSPSNLNNSIPTTVSTIIFKLLEKNTSRRYQNCHALIDDLSRCLRDLQQYGAVTEFAAGEYDIPPTLEIPSRLYHRHTQLQQLHERLERAATGRLEILLISGQSGVGKSSLVHEFKNTLTRDQTYFLEGKFESITSKTPYSTIAWTIRQLIRRILSENSASISRWKSLLQEAATDEWSLLTTMVPELERIIGQLRSPIAPNPIERDIRFFRVVLNFFKACCRTGQPLILFLDDLHRADQASLLLIEHLLDSPDLNHLLFIGTYQETGDDIAQPLQRLLKSLSTPLLLPLNNLQHPDIEHLLSLTLRKEKEEVKTFATICLQKTDGNPFYLRKFLYAIHREGHLFYSTTSGRWEWDCVAIRKSFLTQNAADIMVKGLTSLPFTTCELLKTASCLGESFSLQFVSALHESHPADCQDALGHAMQLGCIFTTDGGGDTPEKTFYHFAHTKIRFAILAMLLPDEQSAIRQNTGKHLLKTLCPEEYNERIHEIASHLNSGFHHFSSRSERLDVAQVNLDAGRKAKNSEEYQTAYSCITAGLLALPVESWQTDYLLSLEIHTEGCETAFLCGEYSDVEKLFQEVRVRATNIHDKFRAYRIHIRAMKAQSRPDKAVSACLEVLSLLGIKIPAKPTLLHSLAALARIRIRLMRYNHDRLLALPQLENRRSFAIMGFLHDMGTMAYSSNPRLLPLLSDHAIRISLKHGNSLESSVIGYLTFGFLLCSLSGRYINQGYQFGQLALQLQEQLNSNEKICQPIYGYSSFIAHWKEHIRNTLHPLEMTIRGYFGRGDLDSTANAACSLSYRHYLIGTNLNRISAELRKHYELIQLLNQQLPLTRLQVISQAVDNLQGGNSDPITLKGAFLNEDEALPACLTSGDYTSYCIAVVIKMIHAVLFHDNQQAIIYSNNARKHLTSITSSVLVPVYYFYDSLARLATYTTTNVMEQLQTRMIVKNNQRKMRVWARHAPMNYGHKYSLVEAEIERVHGNTERAMELYDDAIHLAHEHEYIQEEALGYELAARFYTNRRKPHIARQYLREARYCYYRWGATAKVKQLDTLEVPLSPETESTDDNFPWTAPLGTLIPGEGASRLDMLTVIKASRILSSEMVLDELLKKMMRIMLESGGAQRGFLIFKNSQEWAIRVRGSIYRNSIVTLTDTPISSQNIASTAIINYVIHSATDVVLSNACKEGLFTQDPYILQKRPRSVLCMPIFHQGKVFCILYLENNLAPGAFPPDRQELLHLLGTQGAISLKNSQLFGDLERAVQQLNLEVEKRRSTQQQLLHAEKLSALGRLSASIAHEFGNPLMGVKYLLDDFHKRKNIGEEDRQLLELGLDECDRMKKLIRDLQLLNKPSSGKLRVTNIHLVIENVLLFQKKHFSSNRIRLKKQYDHAIPKVEVIVDQITQVLFNLTMNAVDAMSDGGGTLTVTSRCEEETIIVEIADTGMGIPYENQEQIFEPFYSTKKEEDGTGLGLSISYGIAQYHGGNLSFVSNPGEGTSFNLSLPIALETVKGPVKEVEKN